MKKALSESKYADPILVKQVKDGIKTLKESDLADYVRFKCKAKFGKDSSMDKVLEFVKKYPQVDMASQL